MKAGTRKWLGLVIGILLYYLIHEGAHVIVAHLYGVFKEVRLLGLGVQVTITDRLVLSDFQFAFYNIAGAAATLLTAYVLVFFTKRICRNPNKVMRAVCYYTTLLFLLNDPVYLSLLCGFFGGGDMNGIVCFGIPQWTARLLFGIIGLVNLGIIVKYIFPSYKAVFQQN